MAALINPLPSFKTVREAATVNWALVLIPSSISAATLAGCEDGTRRPVRQTAPANDKRAIAPSDEASPPDAPFDEGAARAAQLAYAKSLGKSSPVEKNSIDMELVLIPPGKFMMGTPASEKGAIGIDVGQVDVLLTTGFCLAKTEVTQRQWRAVMGTTPWKGEVLVREGDNDPATFVSWEDAQTFCKKLSELEHRVYRLPTEAEWEYACRAMTATRFSFGSNEGRLGDYAWSGLNVARYQKDSELYPHEVGRKKPNPFGLYDMHGNVSELCEDVFALFSKNLPGGTDPLASNDRFGQAARVVRGGDFISTPERCRSASRWSAAASSRSVGLGFRVARSLADDDQTGLTTARPDDRNAHLAQDAASPPPAPVDVGKAKAAQEDWAGHLGKSSPVEKNSIEMELVLIPPGKFIMGSPSSEKDRSGDWPQVEVTLTQGFYLGKTEVTQRQWQAVMGTTPWIEVGPSFVTSQYSRKSYPVSPSRMVKMYAVEGDNYPAIYVSWDDAQAFCKKLSEKEKATYRLSTEAEWEYACRGGTTTRFSFGDDESLLGEHGWYTRSAWDMGEKYAHEVGRKKPNPFGLCDMHGNVSEWCEDMFAQFSKSLPGGADPIVTTGGSNRVNRGGGWEMYPAKCGSAYRSSWRPDVGRHDMGFRVVRVISQ